MCYSQEMNNSSTWIPQDWRELLYACSKTQNYLLNSVFSLKHSIETGRRHTLIRSLSSRLKTLESIRSKLIRYGFEDSPTSAAQNLHDIVGVRIICSYLKDIYTVVDELATLEGFRLLQIKDYIKNPKPSGYRSFHVIGECDVSGHPIQCEIQIRTAGMDSWAAIEHQMRYKKDLPDSQYVNQELLECATLLYECDVKMQTLHQYIDHQNLTSLSYSESKKGQEEEKISLTLEA